MPKFVTSIIAYREGPLATVTVADDAYAQRRIFVDGVFVAGTDLAFLTDQKSLAHAPMLLLEDPKSALTVGFGSGGASYSFLLYDELERVDCVEICETVPQMAHLLKDSNHGVLDEWTEGPFSGRKFHNGRYQILLDDARTYLRFTDASYDVIATDCTDLRYKSNANLYDVEYFTLCRQRLTDDGMVVVWFPLAELNDELFACAMKTFAHVFPHMSIWYMHNVPTHYLLLIGTKNDQPLKINVGRLLERIKRPAIQQDLKEVWLHQPEKLLACYVASAPDLIADWDAVTANLNTEDFPHIEFDAPKRFVPPQSIFAHLNGLYRRHRSVADLLEDADQHPEFLKRLEQFEKAALPILEGHFYYRNPEILAARECYRRAMRIAPEDESLAALLTFPELRRIVAHDPDDRAAIGTLAVIEWLDGNFDRAKAMFQRIADPSVSGQAGSASSSGDFDTLGQALEFCYQSSKDPFFRLLRNQIERQVRSASKPG
jgi:spermidine synthase